MRLEIEDDIVSQAMKTYDGPGTSPTQLVGWVLEMYGLKRTPALDASMGHGRRLIPGDPGYSPRRDSPTSLEPRSHAEKDRIKKIRESFPGEIDERGNFKTAGAGIPIKEAS